MRSVGRPTVTPYTSPPRHSAQVPVLYEFGHGLSYTTFAYSMRAEVPGAAAAAAPLHKGPAVLLHVTVEVVNTGGMAADDVVLLFLSFPEDEQNRQPTARQPPQSSGWRRDWRWWRWWQPGPAGEPLAANLPSVTLTLPCAGSDSSYGSGNSGGSGDRGGSSSHSSGSISGSVWPEDVPQQTLAGFERLSSLEPRQSGTARFALTLASFQAFSPLESGTRVFGAPVRPYCSRYVLRAGSQELEVWVQDEQAAAAQ